MINERIEALRKEMKKRGLFAYYITGTDPHQSEYVASVWRTREYITGFTGSAGTVIITEKEALLWVDSRYFLQGEEQIKGSEVVLMKLDTPSTPNPEEWLTKNIDAGLVVGVDGATISIQTFDKLKTLLKEKDVKLEATEDLLGGIWKKRPSLPNSKIIAMDDEVAGFTASAKINFLRIKMRQEGIKWTFISSLDDIAWISNLRADDVPCTPVFISYLFVSLDKAIMWVDEKRFSSSLLKRVKEDFEIKPYQSVYEDLEKETKKGKGAYSDEKTAEMFAPILEKKRNVNRRNITTELKSRKNPVELEGMRRAHFLDGVAFANFMASLDPNGEYSEIEISDRFEKERKNMEGYLGPSFSPISGYREHGAVVHYSATEESNAKIKGHGLLVLDTGSHYAFGTTDLTRTLLFGDEATEAEKRDYTLVLKGHLALARQIFPKGTRGDELNVLAKQFLWASCENYMHGTGHGVGFRLSVHEGPQNISSRHVDVSLLPGMVVSDEPGVYKSGQYGIRIENLIAVQPYQTNEFGEFYNFEVLSMVPYEKKLIDSRYLTDVELRQINVYHKWVYEQLIDYVFDGTKEWLKEATSPITR